MSIFSIALASCGGGGALPSYANIVVRETISLLPGDNYASIQAAPDSVSQRPLDSRGIRGAVLLTAGEYEISNTPVISASGVLLQGQSQGVGGTILKATTRTPESILVSVSGEGLSSP